jgi:choline-glycine betaine transporter
MAFHHTSALERALRKVLVPIFLVSGAVVISAFFFPTIVGSMFSGKVWLIVSLVFFGSGLGYVAVLPGQIDEPSGLDGPDYLLKVRRLSLRETISGFLANQDKAAFGVVIGVFVIFFGLQLLVPEQTLTTINTVQAFLLTELGVLFLGIMLLSVVFAGYLLLGPWGEIKLGGAEATPTYTYPTYFTLFFTAGIAAGIIFWGPAEALFHYQTPPPFFDAAPESGAAIQSAMTYSLFHWGISAWTAYVVIGLPIAYFVYEKGAPLRVSAILTPFLGVEGLDSIWGKIVDIMAIFATIGGIATSVALVSRQFLTGITYQWAVEMGGLGPILFVGGLSLIFILSASTGVARGIRRIAGINIFLFVVFAVMLAVVGPFGSVVDQSTQSLGSYAINFVPMSLYSGPAWVSNWTVWNWVWWFSWAPFAGLFLAALSRGRRIRTVVFTGVVATSAAAMVWFLLFGGTALSVQHTGQADILGTIGEWGGSEAVAAFPILSALPLSQLLIFVFLALIVVFITTSADTSTLVVAILASRIGVAPTVWSIGFWGVFQGGVAIAVLLVGGASNLQSVAVFTGGPFAVLTVVAMVGLAQTLYREEGGHRSIIRVIGENVSTTGPHVDIGSSDED